MMNCVIHGVLKGQFLGSTKHLDFKDFKTDLQVPRSAQGCCYTS